MDTLPWNNMLNLILRLLGRKVLYKDYSRFCGELLLIEDIFGKRLIANGLTQSGSYIKNLWNFAISKVDLEPKNILVLGLGAGSVIDPLRKKWPNVKICGVEIDPKMIEIGKIFFGLSDSDLEIIIQDAFDFFSKAKDKFDLVIVDLFSGDRFPKEAESKNFISNLRNMSSDKSLVIFNRLYFGKHKFSAQKYREFLKKFFVISSKFYPLFLPSNMIIFCKNM